MLKVNILMGANGSDLRFPSIKVDNSVIENARVHTHNGVLEIDGDLVLKTFDCNDETNEQILNHVEEKYIKIRKRWFRKPQRYIPAFTEYTFKERKTIRIETTNYAVNKCFSKRKA